MYSLHASLQSAIDAGTPMTGVLLLSLARAGAATLYRTTHIHALTWNSQTWVADALIAEVGPIPMPGRIVATNWSFALSGIDPQSQGAFNRQTATIYAAFVAAGAVIGDALQLAQGRMSVQALQETKGSVIQPIDVELVWNRGRRTVTHARTDEAQRKRFSGDRAFSDLAKARDPGVTGGESVNIFR